MHVVVLAVSFCIAATLCAADEANPTAQLKNEIPSTFTPRTEGFDYIRRTEMIPMRDGVKLYTVILIPRGARRAPDSPHPNPLRCGRAHHATTE
jgi:predicted acyl esterase